MILGHPAATRLLRSIALNGSKQYLSVPSHWTIKHRMDDDVLRGKLTKASKAVVARIDSAGVPIQPQAVAEQLRGALSIPARLTTDFKFWAQSLHKKFSGRPLILYFPPGTVPSEETCRLIQSLLTSYDSFHLTLLIDLSWKKDISRGRQTAMDFSMPILLGQTLMNSRRWAAARRIFEFPNHVLKRIPDDSSRGAICLNLGILEHKQMRNSRRALHLLHLSKAAFQRVNRHNPMLRLVYNNLGNLYISLGQYETAEQAFKTGLEYAQEVQDDFSMAVTYSSLGRIYLRIHRERESEDAFWTAMMHVTRTPSYDGVHHILIGLGQLRLRQNRLEEAAAFFQSAYDVSCMMKHADAIGLSQLNRAWAAWRMGQNDDALQYLENAMKIFTQIKQTYREALAHHYFYRFALHIRNAALSKLHYRAGRKIVRENKYLDMRILYNQKRVERWILEDEAPKAAEKPVVVKPAARATEPAGPIQIRFWGTRGSIATSSPDHIKFGGNTSCVSIRIGDRLLIFDAGTGIRFLGNEMLKDPALHPDIPIFISHTHWDHIQGFPFFLPAYSPKFKFHIFGPENFNHSISDLFAMQMRYAFFPVRLGAMRADLRFSRTLMGEIECKLPCAVTAFVLNHPVLVYGYRVECAGKTIVYATDAEWMRKDRPPLVGGQKPAHLHVFNRLSEIVNHNLNRYMKDADILIFDVMYTDEEIKTKTGWGHSCISDALDMAQQVGCKQLYLFHHDPMHDDRDVDAMERLIRERAAERNIRADIRAAREGQTISL